MPIYEYFCQICGKFEYLHIAHDLKELTFCPHHSMLDTPQRVKKLLSSGIFQIPGVYKYSLERPQDIRARERSMKNKN